MSKHGMTLGYHPWYPSSPKMPPKMLVRNAKRNAHVATDAPSVPVRAQLDRNLSKGQQRARSQRQTYFCRNA